MGALAIIEEGLLTRDTTVGNASVSKHGLLPKLSGDSADLLAGDGSWVAYGAAALLGTDTDGTLSADSDLRIPTQKAVKTYADSKLAISNNLSDLTNVSAARSNLDLVIGTNVQAYSANLTALATIATAQTGASPNVTLTAQNLAHVPVMIKLASGQTANGFEIQPFGSTTPVMSVTSIGVMNAASAVLVGAISIGGSAYYAYASRSRISSPANSRILLQNAAQDNFDRLQFGGTTSSFPAIKRNSTALNFRLADDSGDCGITAAHVSVGSYAVASLPAAGTAGRLAYANNGRKSGEGSGAGTGCPVWDDGSNWKTFYDNTTVAA